MNGWNVRQVEILPDGARVTLAAGGEEMAFSTPDFGVGARDRKTGAIARFLATSGYGDAIELFEFYADFASDFVGLLIFEEGVSVIEDI